MPNDGDILLLAAAYRHAFMNDLQVISGWLQLEQPARASEYIATLRDSFFGETRMVRAAEGGVAALLLGKRGVAEKCGVAIRFDAAPRVAAFHWGRPETGQLVDALVDAALFVLGSSCKGRRLEVSLQEDDGHRGIALRLVDYSWDEERLMERMGAALAGKGRPFDLAAARRDLEAAGGRWESRRDGDAAVILLSWPKAADEPFHPSLRGD